VADDSAVVAVDFEEAEVLLVVLEAVHQGVQYSDMDRNRRHLRPGSVERYAVEGAPRELVVQLATYPWNDGWEPGVVEEGAPHAVLTVATVEYHEVWLVSELTKARQQWCYHPCLRLEYETSRHLYALLQMQCLYRSRLHNRSPPRSGHLC
jgi:hypothetical protein